MRTWLVREAGSTDEDTVEDTIGDTLVVKISLFSIIC